MEILALLVLLGGCRASLSEPNVQPAASAPRAAPRSDIWVAYSPGGVNSSTTPNRDGTWLASVGGYGSPILSVRIDSIVDNGSLEAGLLTPVGFDSHSLKARDDDEDQNSSDAAAGLRRALMHHRPPVRVYLGPTGEPRVEASAEHRNYEACELRLMRESAEARLAGARNDEQRRTQRERLERLQEGFAEDRALQIANASLLLRLATLPLPRAEYDKSLDELASQRGASPTQWDWRLEQIRAHGRAVALQIDLRSALHSAATKLCRSLDYREISDLRSDLCTIRGVIDRRDGWPITIAVSREGEAANGAKETHARRFDRLIPLEGFVAPRNPCPAGP